MSDKLALRRIIEIAVAALAEEGDGEEVEMEGEGEEGPEGEAADEAEDVREKALAIQALRGGRPHRGTPMQGMHRGMVDAE